MKYRGNRHGDYANKNYKTLKRHSRNELLDAGDDDDDDDDLWIVFDQ